MTPGLEIKNPVLVFAEVEEALVRQPRTGEAALIDDRLGRDQIIVVFCSRRTRAELEAVRQDAGVFHPFICENGAGVFVPEGYFPFPIPNARDVAGYDAIELGRSYTDIVDILHHTSDRLGIPIVGFNDMSVEQVAAECGMPLLRARLAKLREYSELFRVPRWTPAARRALRRSLNGAHLTCAFDTPYAFVGAPVDPEPGVGVLTAMYRRACGDVIAVDGYSSRRDARLTGAATAAEWAEAMVSVAGEARRSHADVSTVATAIGHSR